MEVLSIDRYSLQGAVNLFFVCKKKGHCLKITRIIRLHIRNAHVNSISLDPFTRKFPAKKSQSKRNQFPSPDFPLSMARFTDDTQAVWILQ